LRKLFALTNSLALCARFAETSSIPWLWIYSGERKSALFCRLIELARAFSQNSNLAHTVFCPACAMFEVYGQTLGQSLKVGETGQQTFRAMKLVLDAL
jgi:hypothetical protein